MRISSARYAGACAGMMPDDAAHGPGSPLSCFHLLFGPTSTGYDVLGDPYDQYNHRPTLHPTAVTVENAYYPFKAIESTARTLVVARTRQWIPDPQPRQYPSTVARQLQRADPLRPGSAH